MWFFFGLISTCAEPDLGLVTLLHNPDCEDDIDVLRLRRLPEDAGLHLLPARFEDIGHAEKPEL